jgi:hypothetical protein
MEPVKQALPAQEFKPDIITVGAGPVGLCFAIEEALLALNNNAPKRNHLIIEKHEIYERLHVVILQDRAFARCVKHPLFDPIMQEFQKAKNIPTADLENKFLALIHKLGIKILYEEVKEPKDLPKRFPTAKVIVGAGGSRGIIRTKIFKDAMRRQEEFAYACEIKYRVKGKAENFSPVDMYKMMKKVETIVDERCGKPREDGTSPVTTRFFITKEEYDALKAQNVTFRNPLTLAEINKMPASLREKITYWRQVKKELLNEEPVENSEKITITPLGFYSSREFVKKDPDRDVTWVLVGDEACGAPLFTSLNNGFESAHELARAVDNYFRGVMPSLWNFLWDWRGTPYRYEAYEGNVDRNFAQYASFQLYHTDLHFADITAKFAALNLGKALLYINNNLPWQFVPTIELKPPAKEKIEDNWEHMEKNNNELFVRC